MSSTARDRLPMLGLWLLAAAAAAAGCGHVRSRGDTDFSVTATPGRLTLRQGGSASVEVVVEREDGEDGSDQAITIEIDPDALPAGVSAAPLTVPAGAGAGALVLTAAADAAQGAVDLDVAGTAGDVSRSAPLRLLVAGAPGTADLSFADGGVFTYQVGGMATTGNGLALQPDGKILVTGSAQAQAIAMRLDASGAPDPLFGSGGLVSTGVGDFSGGIVVTALGGGEIVLGGWGGVSADTDLALFGFTAEGAIDEAFASGGADVIDIGDGFGGVVAVLEGDESLQVVGSVFGADSDSAHLARYSIDGERDPDFGGTLVGSSAGAAVLLDDRRVVAAGEEVDDFWLARFAEDGALDQSFGVSGTGTVVSDLGGVDTATGLVTTAADGKLVAVGESSVDGEAPPVLAVARYNSNGSPDLAFGDSGAIVTAIPFDSGGASAAALDGEGRVLVIGRRPDLDRTNLAVVRLLPDGTPDESFGDAGRASIDFDVGAGPTNGAHGVAVDADGRILVSGEIGSDADATLALAVARLWP